MLDPYAKQKAISHFCKRALERHGLLLSLQNINTIIEQVEGRKAQFLRWSEGEGYRSFYRVRIYDEPYIILYDLEVGSPITIYHNSWLKLVDGIWVKRHKHRKGRSHREEKW